jgi:hypothetical protein
MMSVMPYSEHMMHTKLVCKTFLCDEEGSATMVVVEATRVGSNGVSLGS